MDFQLVPIAAFGVVAWLVLLGRGLRAYLTAVRLGDTAPSRIASAAVGELLISGSVDAPELTLVSPLQSAPCVYYRATIDEADGDESSTIFREERAVGFQVRDGTGALRVFPRGARFAVPARFADRAGTFGDDPPGLHLRSGSAFAPGGDRDAQIEDLLTVRPAGPVMGGSER